MPRHMRTFFPVYSSNRNQYLHEEIDTRADQKVDPDNALHDISK